MWTRPLLLLGAIGLALGTSPLPSDYSLSVDRETVIVRNAHRFASNPVAFSIVNSPRRGSISRGENVKVSSWNAVNPTTFRLTLADTSTLDLVKVSQGPRVTELQLLWNSVPVSSEDTGIELCFNYGANNFATSWYSTYQADRWPANAWPLAAKHRVPLARFNDLLDLDWNKPDGFYLAVEQLMLNSDGFGVLPMDGQPLMLRIFRGELCYRLDATEYGGNSQEPLKLRLFSSTNARTVTDYIVHQSGLIPKPTAKPSSFSEPRFLTFSSLTSQAVDSQRKVASQGSQLIVYEYLRNNFTVNRSLVPEISLTGIQFGAAVSVEVPRSEYSQQESLFISKLTGASAWLDLSNPATVRWYTDRLTTLLRANPDIQSVLLKAYDLDYRKGAQQYGLNDAAIRRNPGLLTKKYVSLVYQVAQSLNKQLNIATQTVFRNQDLPVWVQLWGKSEAKEDSLIQLNIANALALGLGGYSWILPFCGNRPSEETFIRYVQATAFFPQMAIQAQPWDNYSPKAVALTKKYSELHQSNANLFSELSNQRLTKGSPILRPLWYNYPDDPKTYTIVDQYMVGADILVAPIMKAGQLERKVYLPEGEWISQIDQSRVKGPKEITVQVPLEQLAYYKKV